MSGFRLLVMEPGGQPREYPVRGEVMIGSSPQSHVQVQDSTVAAIHLTVGTDGSSTWFREDSDATSGTYINGEQQSEGWLTGGEEIQIGNTRIKFLAPEIAAPPELEDFGLDFSGPAEQDLSDVGAFLDEGFSPAAAATGPAVKRPKGAGWTILMIAFYGLAFGSLALGAVLFMGSYGALSEHKDVREVALFKALNQMLQGKALMKQHKWKPAAQTLRKAGANTPKGSPLRLVMAQYVTRANNEWDSLSKYQRAKSAYEQQKNYDIAITLLKKIPNDRQIYPTAHAYYKVVFAKTIKMLLQRARNHLATKNLPAAGEALAAVAKYDPKNAEAKVLTSQLEKLEEATPEGRRRIQAQIAKLKKGVVLFRSGRASAALAFFKNFRAKARSSTVKRRATTYINSINSFKNIYSKGRKALRSGNNSKAITLLKKAREMDGLLGGGNRAGISKRLARAYYNMGRAAHRRKKYGQAYSLYKRSNSISSNGAASGGIRRIQAKARTFLKQADSLKGIADGDARRLARLVMRITPRGSSLWRRARSIAR